MSQKQITTSKASCTIRTFKGLFFGVRSLVALEVLQSREGTGASGANVGPRLISLGGWDIAIGARLAIQVLFLRVFGG